MKRVYKGAFWIPLIIGIAIAVVVIGIIIYAFGGKGFGGGKGDGVGSNSVSADSSISEDFQTETVDYINITVSGNDYLFQNQKMNIDELMLELNSTEEKFPVKITDDGASIKAYDALVKALKDNDIRYIEQESN